MFEMSHPQDSEGRDNLRIYLKAVNDFEGRLDGYIADGKIALHKLQKFSKDRIRDKARRVTHGRI